MKINGPEERREAGGQDTPGDKINKFLLLRKGVRGGGSARGGGAKT